MTDKEIEKRVEKLRMKTEEEKLQKALAENKTARECLEELGKLPSLYGRHKNKFIGDKHETEQN